MKALNGLTHPVALGRSMADFLANIGIPSRPQAAGDEQNATVSAQPGWRKTDEQSERAEDRPFDTSQKEAR
ncbi:hypothetical protein [Paraburkholderia humisilvae]|uniref:hypothetical protein n=1 Tax=Paraburkholderia humisilvae TaxID=627669 RepID=UPI001C2E72F1|nr:hypothetical protein [Paraburkholderia humisilvae]